MWKSALLSITIFVVITLCQGCGGEGGGNNPFVGNYAGNYDGDESGVMSAQVSSSGFVTGTVVSPSLGRIPLNGTVTSSGGFDATTTGGSFIITYKGQMVNQAGVITASGTWSSTSGFTGTWTMQQITSASPFAGNYTGTLTGSSGTLTLTGAIGSSGNVNFTIQSIGPTAGFVAPDGRILFSSGPTGAPDFIAVGTMTVSGAAVSGSGNWTSSTASGTWQAQRQ